MDDSAAAFKKIFDNQAVFISRGDNSGTHIKEQFIWKESGVQLVAKEREIIRRGESHTIRMAAPEGDWYRSVGQGMGQTIQHATEKRGYTLTDRGTYYAYALGNERRTDLVILCEGDKRLHNPYGVIAVNPERFPHINHEAAKQYIEWITSPRVRKMIGAYKKSGKVLFHPAADTSSP